MLKRFSSLLVLVIALTTLHSASFAQAKKKPAAAKADTVAPKPFPDTVAFQRGEGDPRMTEIWSPVPRAVAPAKVVGDAPSDAIVLFNGQDLSAWEGKDGGEAKWKVADGVLTIEAGAGEIRTKQAFGDCQLHIEWRISPDVKGVSQERGNSGIFLMSHYELQVLDSHEPARTYVNGMAGSIYKQHIPLVNASRSPGEWQSYDVIFTAPRFNADGRAMIPGTMTLFYNGVLVQNHVNIMGNTNYKGFQTYTTHADKLPLSLQDHGNPTSFRNIWIRPI
jgi:Domain of Unknown Function (DUF1080)